MKGWSEITVADLGKVVTGKTPSKDHPEEWGNEVLFLTPTDYNYCHKYVYNTLRKLSSIGKNNHKQRLIPKKSIMVTCIGSDMGKTLISKYETVTNQQINSIIINDRYYDVDFIYYLFRNIENELKLLGGDGSAVPILNKSDFSNIIVEIPTKDEQRAIAAVLSNLDDKIDLLQRQNATLEAMAEALFRQWFVVEAKEDWEEKSLQDEFNIFIGRTPPRKEQKCFSFENGEKWISIKDMGAPGIFISDSSEYLTQQAINTYKIPLIPKNTVVLSFKMTVGRVKITTAPMYSNEAIACFVPNSTTYLPKEFLYLFLKQYKFDELGTTSSIVTAINSNMIKNIIFKLPPESLLEMFTQQSEKLFAKIRSNQTQIRILEKLRNSLLPKLMSGEVRLEY